MKNKRFIQNNMLILARRNFNLKMILPATFPQDKDKIKNMINMICEEDNYKDCIKEILTYIKKHIQEDKTQELKWIRTYRYIKKEVGDIIES